MADLLPFSRPANAEEHAEAETERKEALFKWAKALLEQLGIADRIEQARDPAALRMIGLDDDAIAVAIDLAINEALHPVTGNLEPHFIGMTKGMLRRLIKARFAEAKKEREAQFRSASSAPPDWTAEILYDSKGRIQNILANLVLFLRHHPDCKGALAHDEFAERVVVRKAFCGAAIGAEWADHHDDQVRIWFQRQDIKAARTDCGRAVQVAARANGYHPVREYLSALGWDGTPRIDTWLHTYLHAADSHYARAVGPRWLISAVARIFDPGAKVDHTPIFEGPQGKQKSESLRTLAVRDEWFTDRLSRTETKDAAQETAGVWIIELAELDAMIRSTSSAMKSFLTRRVDRYRPPYGKRTIRRPRQCVFAGTINPDGNGYLDDPTGARRVWPVLCPGWIDLAALKRDRDQLWAEAVMRYRAGASWWLESPALEALATAEQKKRFKVDPWEPVVTEWLADRPEVSTREVLEECFRIEPRAQNKSVEMRVAAILVRLGYRRYTKTKGKRERRWRKSPGLKARRQD